MKLYVVRHTETEWNVTGQAQGHHDSPLTEKGIEQSRDLAARLKPLAGSIEAYYSSDLGRCVHTAKIISKAIGKEPVLSSQLRERSYGDYTGWHKDDVWKKLDIKDLDISAPGGESAKNLASRVNDFLETLDDKTTLCVVHDGVIRYLLGRALKVHPYSEEASGKHGVIYEFSLIDGQLDFKGQFEPSS